MSHKLINIHYETKTVDYLGHTFYGVPKSVDYMAVDRSGRLFGYAFEPWFIDVHDHWVCEAGTQYIELGLVELNGIFPKETMRKI